MNNAEFQRWLDTVHRRPLSAAEQSELEDLLSRHPEWRDLWLEEAALTRLLVELPDSPLPVDFTARVLGATGLSTRRARPIIPFLRALRLPRPAWGFAAGALAIALGAIGFVVQKEREQTRFAHYVADISRQIALAANATQLPAVQLFQDFEAIHRLDQPQMLVDEELLAALQ